MKSLLLAVVATTMIGTAAMAHPSYGSLPLDPEVTAEVEARHVRAQHLGPAFAENVRGASSVREAAGENLRERDIRPAPLQRAHGAK